MRKIAIAVISVVGFCASDAQAGFINSYTGNSFFTNGAAATEPKGWVSFAAYVNDGTTGNWITDLTLGGLTVSSFGTLTGTERAVLFYQVVTNPTGTFAIE